MRMRPPRLWCDASVSCELHGGSGSRRSSEGAVELDDVSWSADQPRSRRVRYSTWEAVQIRKFAARPRGVPSRIRQCSFSAISELYRGARRSLSKRFSTIVDVRTWAAVHTRAREKAMPEVC